MPTVYVSGPMSGLPDNYPAFAEAAAKLRADGHNHWLRYYRMVGGR